jgi:hypothetical protein
MSGLKRHPCARGRRKILKSVKRTLEALPFPSVTENIIAAITRNKFGYAHYALPGFKQCWLLIIVYRNQQYKQHNRK